VVTWVESYAIFATTTPLQAGATIAETAMTGAPVQAGWTYTFQNGRFEGASGGASGSFNVVNQQSGAFSFGLSQQASVNNVQVNAPLNATPVLFSASASFVPEATVSVFLSSSMNNGVVLSQVPYNALTISLTLQNPTANIGFDDSNETFYLESREMSSRRLSHHDRAKRT
jgi:hypothetical protein